MDNHYAAVDKYEERREKSSPDTQNRSVRQTTSIQEIMVVRVPITRKNNESKCHRLNAKYLELIRVTLIMAIIIIIIFIIVIIMKEM